MPINNESEVAVISAIYFDRGRSEGVVQPYLACHVFDLNVRLSTDFGPETGSSQPNLEGGGGKLPSRACRRALQQGIRSAYGGSRAGIGAIRDSNHQPYLNISGANQGEGNFTLPFDLDYEIGL
jgi:hypothetical protein